MKIALHIPPPVWGLLTLAFCKAIAVVFPVPFDFSYPTFGIVLAGLSGSLMFWAWLNFLQHKTTPIPTGEPSALVATGPYRHTRNPMYLGLIGLLISVTFFTGSAVYLISPLLTFYLIDKLFIPFEEAKLEKLFSLGFADMKSKTRRWL